MINRGAIIQPLFFPWAGYFHLISRSNYFIFLDDAQYKKNWSARNKFLINGALHFLYMPLKKQSQNTNFNKKNFSNFINDYDEFKKTIFDIFKEHKYKDNIFEIFQNVPIEHICINLSNFNTFFIKKISDKLGFKTKFFNSSLLDIDIKKKRSDKLISICDKLKINLYLSPNGSKEYMKEDNFQDNFNGRVIFNKFIYSDYVQYKQKKFTPYLTILDLIANIGWKNSSEYIYSDELLYS